MRKGVIKRVRMVSSRKPWVPPKIDFLYSPEKEINNISPIYINEILRQMRQHVLYRY